MDDVLSRNDLRDDKDYVVQYYSKHFEHIVDFLTTFLRPVPSIAKQMPCFQKTIKFKNTAGRKYQR